jgi:glycolate oxidase FAD binding subunit
VDLSRPRTDDPVLEAFRADVGTEGPVCVSGGRTQWSVGGLPDPGTREVTAPDGVVHFEPSELVVRVRAGTTVADLDDALAPHGQCVALTDGPGATVGGVLVVGRSGLRALGWGPVRSTLLEATYVDAWGRLVRAGAPVVKNVTGFDLCRLLVGSLGTLGLVAEVVLRTRPLPPAGAWRTGPADAAGLRAVWSSVERPSTVLWDGRRVWVHVEGHPDDVAASVTALAVAGCGEPCDGPPALPPVRSSLPVAAVAELPARWPGRFVAEVGVGIVHGDVAAPVAPMDARLALLHRTVKARFDPDGRLNPGRSPLGSGGTGTA